MFAFNGYGADVNSTTPVVANQNYIGAITKGPALGDVIRLYLNGPQVQSGTAGLVDYTSTAITVGANNDPNNSEWWNGHIAEVLVYSRELTAQELNATGSYLKFKYGLITSYTDLGLVLQPQNQTAFAGAKVTFSALAVGTRTTPYQWYKGAGALPGATSPDLVLNTVQLSDAGDYFVVANNSAGSVTSVVASLTVSLPRERR